ncbi:MAG: VP2 [Gokushovirus NL-1994]|nr:MAG: VP2 [Gokushovirus NL-1994]
MSWLGKFAGSALGAVGGFLANRDQKRQFQMNYDLAKNQLYNQHQIEVADLRAAGLNPILSANGGNSTFGASSGGSYENVGASANSGYMAAQQAKNLEAQNAAIDANIVKTKAEAQNVIADTALKQAQTANTKGLTSLIPLQRQNIWAMTEQAKAQTESWKMQVKVAEANIQKTLQDILNSIRITDASVHELNTRSDANEAAASASSAAAARSYAEAWRIENLTPYQIEQISSETAENMARAGNLDEDSKRIAQESIKIMLANEQEQSVQDIKTGFAHRFGTSMAELLRFMPFSAFK